MKLSSRIKQIEPSLTLTITSKAKAMMKEGIDVISFGAGEPDFDTPLYIKEAASSAIERGETKYTPSIGSPELRDAIAEKLLRFNGVEYAPDDIVVSCGAKHSLYNIFQAICQEGDEVIIPSPYWVSYPEMVKLSGARPLIVPAKYADGFKISPQALSSAINENTKAIIINSPANPTGSIYSREELAPIAEAAAGHDIYIISDEIYERLIYDGREHISIASLNAAAKDRTILVSGVSKTYSMTGWRIGYMASPAKELTSHIKRLQDHSTSNPSSVSQAAALAALTREDDSVEKMKAEFEKRRDYMMKRICANNRLRCINPSGAFYCFVDISKLNKSSLDFSNRLLEEARVAVIPGEGFGAGGYIRLSFAAKMANIKEGLDRIERWLRQ